MSKTKYFKKMRIDKTIGILLILGTLGVIIPYTILTMTFNYPDILRQDSKIVLNEFYAGGNSLIYTWLAFALLGLPLIVAYSLIGKKLERKNTNINWITTIGIISGIVQIIGLLRWVFVVPVLAHDLHNTSDQSIINAIIINFKVIHQLGGVLLGEHLGQLFTITWTVGIAHHLFKNNIIPKWMKYFAYITSTIYFLAQTELLGTVIKDFPVIDIAGFLGSTLWLIWLFILGIIFLKNKS